MEEKHKKKKNPLDIDVDAVRGAIREGESEAIKFFNRSFSEAHCSLKDKNIGKTESEGR